MRKPLAHRRAGGFAQLDEEPSAGRSDDREVVRRLGSGISGDVGAVTPKIVGRVVSDGRFGAWGAR